MSVNYGSKRVVTGAHYGLRDWLAQRVTGALMAFFTAVLLVQVKLLAPAAPTQAQPLPTGVATRVRPVAVSEVSTSLAYNVSPVPRSPGSRCASWSTS